MHTHMLPRQSPADLPLSCMHHHVAALQVEQRLQGKEAENQELMSMCDQLLQQQEAHLRAA